MYAVNALKGQFLGQGGGDEVNRSAFLNGLEHQLGHGRGFAAFNDLRQFKNPRSVTTVNGSFPYGHIPARHPGSVVVDNGSYQATPSAKALSAKYDKKSINASNELMVSGKTLDDGAPHPGRRSADQLLHAGIRLRDRHARAAQQLARRHLRPLPGLSADRAHSAFLQHPDLGQRGHHRPVRGDALRRQRDDVPVQGRCLPMGHFDAGTINPGAPSEKHVDFMTTVHGPVVGYATVHGRQVAISSKRSSYGRDVLDQLFFRRLSNGSVKSPQTFFKAASLTPQTFNSFYIDRKHIAEYTSGRLPIRPPNTDPGLLTKGTGQFEWRGFVKAMQHPHGMDNKAGYMTNWNNGVARGFGAADNEWGRNGSVGRVNLLTFNLKRLARRGKWSPSSVTSAMNAAATQDVRAVVMGAAAGAPAERHRRALPHGQADARSARQLAPARRQPPRPQQRRPDRQPGRGDHGWRLQRDREQRDERPARWPHDTAEHAVQPVRPAARGQYSGWYMYFDRDIRSLLSKKRQPDRFSLSYCGGGRLSVCRSSIWAAIQAAGDKLSAQQGTSDPAAWRASATAEQIHFSPLQLITMRYTNRPSGIQQVISFK